VGICVSVSRKIVPALAVTALLAAAPVAQAAYSGKKTNRNGTTRLYFDGGLVTLTVSKKVARGQPAFAVDCRSAGGATSFAVAGTRRGQRRFTAPASPPSGSSSCRVKQGKRLIATVRVRRA
jgi:hypothetical protein